jgi:transcription factor IIIB subunit 2
MQTCPTCGPTEVEVDDRMGHSVCIQCGNVLELNTIVSEITFTESSNGAAMADGFSVAAGSARAKSSLPGKFGLIRTGTAEPREQTIANGHKKIQEVASQSGIRMPERHIQAAQRFFNLAVINSFTKVCYFCNKIGKKGTCCRSCMLICCM